MTYYLIPLGFYFLMGAVFSSINPSYKQTLTASMAIFAVTMGAVMGMPIPIVKMRESGVLRSYRISGIPGWAVLLIQSVSAFLHLLVVSIIIFITAPLLFGANNAENLPAYFLILFVLLFVSISIGLLIGVVAGSQPVATMFSQALFLPTMMLSGIMFSGSMLPEPLKLLGRLIPATYIMQCFSGLAYNLSTDIQPIIALLITVVIGVMAASITVVRFNKIQKSL